MIKVAFMSPKQAAGYRDCFVNSIFQYDVIAYCRLWQVWEHRNMHMLAFCLPFLAQSWLESNKTSLMYFTHHNLVYILYTSNCAHALYILHVYNMLINTVSCVTSETWSDNKKSDQQGRKVSQSEIFQWTFSQLTNYSVCWTLLQHNTFKYLFFLL